MNLLSMYECGMIISSLWNLDEVEFFLMCEHKNFYKIGKNNIYLMDVLKQGTGILIWV